MGTQLALQYHFEPGSLKDGVTLVVPLALLNQVDERRCAWLVPGLCVEKIHLLLKTLPQKLRRHFVPLPEFAKGCVDDCLEQQTFGKGDLIEALIKHMRDKTQVVVARADFRPENLPLHCQMNYRMMDEHGRQLDLDRNLSQLRAQYAKDAREIFQEAASLAIQEVSRNTEPTTKSAHPLTPKEGQKEQSKITDWNFGELPEMLEIQKGKQSFYGYPALEDAGTHCELNVYDDPELARKTHFRGMRRLSSIAHKDTLKLLQKQLPGGREIGLLFMQIGTHEEIMQQILDLAIERSCLFEPLPRNTEEFKTRMQVAKTKLSLIAQDIAKQTLQCLELSAEIPKKLTLAKGICPAAFEDMQLQYQQLVNRQFVAQTPYEQMVHIPRYLKGIMVRVEKLRTNLTRDQENQAQWQRLQRQYIQVMKNLVSTEVSREIHDIRWQLEELRIALYAQELKTPTPMSVKRIEKILNSIRS